MYRALLLSLTCLASSAAHAIEYKLPTDGSNIVGTTEYYEVKQGDSLADIANKYNVGFLGMMAANKGVDPFLPQPGKLLQIPTQVVLPDVDHKGIVVNLAELRLYYFPKNDASIVYIFPIGIGRVGRETPNMTTSISEKVKNPTWTPPASIRKEHAARGDILPAVVPAGPDNPLGDYKMRLAYGHGEYLIHGTNKDFGIGMRVSGGCIRMNPWDVEWLFPHVALGTQVQIINQPVKTSRDPDGELIVEVHAPLSKDESQMGIKKNIDAPKTLLEGVEGDTKATQRLYSELDKQSGLPAILKS
ncbi:peptidase [Photobacterium phosphoreum]|uniref:L,D-transpeptidase family protein n=1 Tax=Photobacterium phosphoreum TaxID=659 RepID=UPI000D152AC4|nr:L,D-transpeptidase family protein [Photobacterium phosphoreum]PSW25680.1 peptidase [Photobacterium phosphoreum]